MSKKKTGAEMVQKLIKQYIKAHPEVAEEIEETIEEVDPCINWEVHYCSDCPALDDEENEEENEDEEEEEEYYRYPECECVDGECDQCEHWVYNDCCELDDEGEDCEEEEDCDCCDGDCDENCKYWNWDELCCELNNSNSNNDKDMRKGSKEYTQTEELSKFIMSVGAVLGGDMGLLVFDKSNKKDMEKLAAIFEEYAKRL